MTNSEDPDQLASSEAKWSGSTLFAEAGHIRIQQNQGKSAKQNCCRQHSKSSFVFFSREINAWNGKLYLSLKNT